MSFHREGSDESKRADGRSSFKKMTVVSSVSTAEEMNPRFRASMEDTHVAEDSLGSSRTSAFFGIYDGHGGREVAEYLRKHLHENVAKEVASKSHKDVEHAIASAYLITDVNCQKALGETSAGSTAVTVLVRLVNKSRMLFTANCGDARAVLATKTGCERLSFDHKATDQAEIERIEKAGGFVLRRRVIGVLAVARSFGDYALKAYVPCTPYCSRRKLDPNCQFVIIACDGVWDVLEDQAAVDQVKAFLKAGGKQARAAQHLVHTAIEKGSTDNVTCQIVFL